MSDFFGAIPITPQSKPPSQRNPRKEQKKIPSDSRTIRKKRRNPQPSRPWIAWSIGIPLVLILLYGLAVFFLAPSLLTKYLCSSLQAATNMEWQVGKAVFNPFTFHLQLLDIVGAPQPLPDAAADAPPFRINSLLTTVSLSTLLRQEIACDFVEIEGGTADLVRFPDNSYNLPFINPGRSAAGTDQAALAAVPHFSLNALKIKNSALSFDDRLTGQKHRVEQIDLDIPSFSDTPSVKTGALSPNFSAIINGSPLRFTSADTLPETDRSRATQSNEPGAQPTNFSCSLENLDLPLYFAYLPLPNSLKLISGKGNGAVTISFAPADGKNKRLTLAFTLKAADLHLTNSEQTLSLQAPTLQINGSWQPIRKGLTIHTLQFDNPRLSIETRDGSSVVSSFFATPLSHSQGQERPAPPPLVIAEILVKNGSAQLTDKQKPHKSPPWTAIELVVKKFPAAPDPRAEEVNDKGSFFFSGQQESSRASVTWQGEFNELGRPEGELQLANFPATTLFSFIPAKLHPQVSGTTNLRGHFSFDPTARNGTMLTLLDASAEIHDFSLGSPQRPWLTAQKMQMKGTKLQEGDCDLGHISILEGAISWQQGQRPPFFMNIDAPQKNIFLQSLSFSGTADLQAEKAQTSPLRLTDLRLKADNLSSTSDGQANFDFSAAIHQDGRLKAQGLLALFPVRAQLNLSFTGLKGEQIAPWLPDAPLFQNSQSIISGQGKYHFPELSYTGNVQLESALLHTPAGKENNGVSPEGEIVIPRAELIEARIKANPLRIHGQELLLHGPRFTWQRADHSPLPLLQLDSFLQKLLTPTSPPPSSAGAEEFNKNRLLAGFQKISFEQGQIQHKDQRFNPPWTITLSQLQGSLTNPSGTPEQTCRYEVAGLLDETPFTLAGAADLRAENGDFNTRLDLQGFPLRSLTDQITPLLDIAPQSAIIDLSLQQQRTKGEEQGEATIVCAGLRPPSAQSASALPLALLSDQRQQIQLRIPLTSADPRPLPLNAISTLRDMLTQAANSPWTATGDAFSDLQDRRFVLFAAGQSELDEISQESLRPFLELLTAHPQVGLTLTGMADPVQDRAFIFQQLQEKEKIRVDGINEQRLRQWEERQQKRQLAAANRAKSGAPPGKIIEPELPPAEPRPTPILPESVSVPDALLQVVAKERALQVYDYFTSKLGSDSRRIFIEETTKLGNDEEPGTQVVIGLKAVIPDTRPSLP